MIRITPHDTDTIFGFGSGALGYSWWGLIESAGTWAGDEKPTRDDWFIKVVEIEDFDDETEGITHTFTHQDIMRAVRLIASKKGEDIPYLSKIVRKECQTLVFKGPDEVDFDAPMADEVLQVAAFGKVVYG